MRVVVNALPLRHGGGVSYLHQQLHAIADAAPDIELHTLVSPWAVGLDELPGTTQVVRVRSVVDRFAYEQFVLPFRRADLVYCPANFAPFFFSGPLVLTLHNPNYYGRGLELPEVAASRPWWKVKANHWAVRRATAVVAISESMAEEVRETLPGLRNLRVILSGNPEWPAVSVRVPDLPERYLLAFGSMAPHKRIAETVEGWARSADRVPDAPSLLVVGPIDEVTRTECKAAAGRHLDQLVLHGQVKEREKMRWIYEHAEALVSSSVLETFSMTPGEAASVGCPLVLSDLPVHREVTAGRAHFVAPGDVEGLANTLVTEIYSGRADRTPWLWTTTWRDNAEQFVSLFRSLAQEKR